MKKIDPTETINPILDWTMLLEDIAQVTKDHEVLPAWAMMCKITEELGEMNETFLHDEGYLAHKDKEWESVIGEAADVIICVVGALATHYEEDSALLVNILKEHINMKLRKYRRNILKLEE